MSSGGQRPRHSPGASPAAPAFTGVKVFSATLHEDRQRLGDRVSQWLALSPGVRIVDKAVLQSSDHGFHCLSITLFYCGEPLTLKPE